MPVYQIDSRDVPDYFTGGTSLDVVHKFGRNVDVDNINAEDVWDGGGVWAPPAEARIHAIASTDANDTAAGTGVRTIRVYGLTSWSTLETSEDVTMDGTTPVNTAGSYVIINRMHALTAGSNGLNLGDITATAATDATVTSQITTGQGQTQQAIYGVSDLQSAYMVAYYAGINRSVSGSFNANLLVNSTPDVNLEIFLVKHTLGSNTHFTMNFNPPLWFVGPCIIKIQADAGSVNSDISAGFNLVLRPI